MRQMLIIGLVTLTSVGGLVYGRAVRRLPSRRVPVALGVMLECMGFGLVFFAVNSVVALCVILLLRFDGFVSLYALTDITLVILSFLQGLLFRLWRCEENRLRSR